MIKMTSLHDKLALTGELVDWDMPDAEGVKERFINGFAQHMEDKKRTAVDEILSEEFPYLCHRDGFREQVMTTLGHNLEDERRFVFLVVNPKYKLV